VSAGPRRALSVEATVSLDVVAVISDAPCPCPCPIGVGESEERPHSDLWSSRGDWGSSSGSSSGERSVGVCPLYDDLAARREIRQERRGRGSLRFI
jgi:hypothetical protein